MNIGNTIVEKSIADQECFLPANEIEASNILAHMSDAVWNSAYMVNRVFADKDLFLSKAEYYITAISEYSLNLN